MIYSGTDIAKVYRRYCQLCSEKSPNVIRERNATLALLRHLTGSRSNELALTRGRSAAGIRKRWRRSGLGRLNSKRGDRVGLPRRITSVVVNDVGRGKRQ